MIELLELEQAYKKLKSHLYNDKTLLEEKIRLGRFETNLETNLNNLLEAIKNKDISQWTKDISYTLVPKKLKDVNKDIQSSIPPQKSRQF